jgi:hypothetical protein
MLSDGEPIARRLRLEEPRGQLLAQLCHEDLHHLVRTVGDPLAPELVDEAADGDDAVCVQQQQREQRRFLARPRADRPSLEAHVQWAQDQELHRRDQT